MPTYRHPTTQETWEISLEGLAFRITSSSSSLATKPNPKTKTKVKAKSTSKTTTRKFVTEAHAKQQYEKAIAAQVAAGFVLVPEEEKGDDDALMASPDDLEALAVHADALMDRGHFLGEVIAAQLEIHKLASASASARASDSAAGASALIKDDPEKRTRLATEARKLLSDHTGEIFGSFAPHVLSIVPKGLGEPTGQYAACTASWRCGVVDEVALAASSKIALAETIPALAKLPLARFLRSIVCGSSAPPSSRFAPVAYDRFLVALIAHADAFPRLRALYLGDLGEGRVAAVVGSLDALYAAFPKLEVLRLHADAVVLGSIGRLTKLREIELAGQCASLQTLQRIRDAGLDDLVAVTADTMRTAFGELGTALSYLSAQPKLERLALRGWGGERKIAAVLKFKRLAQLKELDLSHNDLLEELQTLVDNADRFTHLDKLDLRFNNFTAQPVLFRELRERLPKANFAGQAMDGRMRAERYEGISE